MDQLVELEMAEETEIIGVNLPQCKLSSPVCNYNSSKIPQ
jgi:hypothetical protein